MELRMPWFDGAAACRQIRSKASLREIPVLLMSGLPEKQTLERSVGSGATGILPKPFDKDALVAAVRACFPEPAAATTA
jgi:two-component system sensor histidine kinase ChiS